MSAGTRWLVPTLMRSPTLMLPAVTDFSPTSVSRTYRELFTAQNQGWSEGEKNQRGAESGWL